MAKDLKVDIDGVRLNVRVGVIMRYQDQVVIEISRVGRNSVVPGGRVKINEKSSSAIVREMKEEMNITLKENKLKMITTFENFFTYDNKGFHEIYFLYDYNLSMEEIKEIDFNQNKDNKTTYFKLVSPEELPKYNLLPLELYDFIKNPIERDL